MGHHSLDEGSIFRNPSMSDIGLEKRAPGAHNAKIHKDRAKPNAARSRGSRDRASRRGPDWPRRRHPPQRQLPIWMKGAQ
jgi:hypothetical protein